MDELAKWFAKRCDGFWEDEWSIQRSTTSTPSWYLRIELYETPLKD